MENIEEKLNLVIEYIECCLTDKIEQEKIAQLANCSYYDVCRIFSLIADINISDYIRKRRLTMAGIELKYDGAKVIDVALKYGYDSHISFARAFRAFHGFNPSLASRDEMTLKICPRLMYQKGVKKLLEVIKKEVININGKDYKADYYGEQDMSQSPVYSKRKYWRLENAWDDLKDKLRLESVLPYVNYPPINIKNGDMFVIDFYRRETSEVERKYYVADGTVWNGMRSTREFVPYDFQPIRIDKISINGRDYKASYFGEQDLLRSDYFIKREYWRLENMNCVFENCEKLEEVLPYNNYPPIKIENGQVFVIDCYTIEGTIERRYYIADGTVWEGRRSTRRFRIDS